jgi:hypothetical protein
MTEHPRFCNWPGCGVPVVSTAWVCSPHWFALPQRLRNKIWETYRPMREVTEAASKEYLAVVREIEDWIARNAT